MSDPYNENPLAQMLAERNPTRYEELTRVSQPPKMFANGTADVPAFTASGVDPTALLRLPFGVRHAAAEERDITAVYRIFEEYAGYPDAEIDCRGLQDAKLRAEGWLRDTDPRTPQEVEQANADDDAWYAATMREGDRFGLTHDEHVLLRDVPAEERNVRLNERQREVEQARRVGQPIGAPEWAQAEGAQA